MVGSMVICVATPEYVERWSFALTAQRAYAQRHGLSHVLITDVQPGLNAKWSKIAFALKHVLDGTNILLVDADAAPTDIAPSFRAILDEHHRHDVFYALGNSDRANSGVMMFRGGPESAARIFLEAMLDHRNDPVNEDDFVTADGENGHVIQYLRDSQVAPFAMELSRAWNVTHRKRREGALICHYTGDMRRMLEEGASPIN